MTGHPVVGPLEGVEAASTWAERSPGAPVEALLLDLDGVVHTGTRALPGAVTVPAATRDGGGVVRFVTNNAFRTPAQVAARLADLGVPADPGEVVTSAVVAVDLVHARVGGGPVGEGRVVVAVVGGPGLLDPLAAAGLDGRPARTVPAGTAAALVQGFSPDTTWHDLAAAAHHVRAGTWWVATNLDPTLPTEDGPAPGNGSLVRAVATAAGKDPDLVAGKPDPVMVERALPPSLRREPARAVMVGDRLDTDIEAARAAGVTAMLVLCGVHEPADLLAAPPARRPHLVGHDLRDLTTGHPPVVVDGRGVARCRKVTARVRPARGGDPADVRIDGGVDDCALDVLRALCAATWSVVDELPADDRPALLAAVTASGALPTTDTVTRDGCGQGAATLPGHGRDG